MLDYSINMEINWLSNDKFADNHKTNDNQKFNAEKKKMKQRSHGTMNKLIFVSVLCVRVFLSSL